VISQCYAWLGGFKLHAVRLRRSHRWRGHRVPALQKLEPVKKDVARHSTPPRDV
jgi:hypothetical protein